MRPRIDVWTLLGSASRRRDCLAAWKCLLGEHFDLIEPSLRPCAGEYGRWYPDEHGTLGREIHRAGDNWWAVMDNEDHLDEFPVPITEADARAYRLDEQSLWARLGRGLHLTGTPAGLEPGLCHLGECTHGPARRQVYLCHAPEEKDAITWAMKVAGRNQGTGCLLLPAISDLVRASLTTFRLSGVNLSGSLGFLRPETPVGACGYACRHLAPRDITVRDLKGHLDGRLDTLGERVVALRQENETLKQNLARMLTEFARRVDPEFLAWVFVVLAAGSVRGAAKALKLPKSTLDERIKQYADRGGVYQLLFEALDIRRKGMGQGPVERFDELMLRHHPEGRAPGPDLWRELLDGLEALNGDNWEQVRAELIELLRLENPDA